MMKPVVKLRRRGPLLVWLLLLFGVRFAMAQEVKLTGKVTDARNEPLPGVSVILEGTATGTITDFNGFYKINVPADAQLTFTFIGMASQTVSINGMSVIDVVLEDDLTQLDEIVVVGYGEMKKSDLTGSVASISNDAITKTVTTSADQVLQGRAAGVQVRQNSGTPGGGSSIRIRGISSLTGTNEPIIVIDGVILSGSTGSNTSNVFATINPADIASIDVLKDASATAIYGSRAANGVIIINTKKGKKGETRFTYNGYVGVQEIPKKMDLLNLQEYAIHKNTRSDLGLVQRDDRFVRTDLLGEGTDWQKELFDQAVMQSHNVSMSGGAEQSTYAMSLGYLDQDGIAIGSSFERYTLRGNFDSRVKDFLKMGVNFTMSNSNQVNTVSDDALISTALRQTPDVAVRNADGSFDGPNTTDFVQNNPVGLARIKDNRNKNLTVRASTFAEATIIEGLTFKTEYAVDYGMSNSYRFNPSYSFGALENTIRESTRTKSFNQYFAWRNILTYKKDFGKHSLTVMVGHDMQKTQWENLSGYRSGFLTNDATDLNLGDAQTARNSNSSGESSLLSFFGRTFYSFDDKYLLTATLRYDGSSKFQKDNRWGWFPAVAVGWNLSNEGFLKSNSIIENLKLRAGWGGVGNQAIDNNAYTATYGSSATAKWGTGLLAANTPNPDVRWETTYSTNIGLNLSLFQNRIEVIADVYYKKTNDLLLDLPLPAYAGTTGQGSTSPPIVNIGSLENKGIELTLQTVNLHKNSFMWTSNVVFSMNRNKVVKLATESGILNREIQQGSESTIVTRTVVGKPIGQFYGYKVIGRFESATDFYYVNSEGEVVPTALPEDMSIGENSVWVGDYMFADINNDGVIDEEDRTFIGNPSPDFTLGFGNNFSYKGFDLNVFLNGVFGNEVVNYQRRWLENPRGNSNLLKTATDYARLELINPEGPNDYRNVQIVGGDPHMPRIGLSSASSTSNYRFSDRFVENGSYVRIQSISLSYRIPQKWVSMMRLHEFKVYANLQNVYTFTKYSGYDAEIGSSNQDALLTGIDNGRYPSPRIYTLGVNLTF